MGIYSFDCNERWILLLHLGELLFFVTLSDISIKLIMQKDQMTCFLHKLWMGEAENSVYHTHNFTFIIGCFSVFLILLTECHHNSRTFKIMFLNHFKKFDFIFYDESCKKTFHRINRPIE